jgi:hypothetical protein
LDDTSPPFSVPRAFSGDENNPALQLDGDFRVIWCLHRSDGFYYWDWKKFDAWEIHNWQKLDKNQKISMKIIRKLMTDPEVYGSPYTERHHTVPKSQGGNPDFSEEWCVSLTYANHLIIHVCLALVLPHNLLLHRSVGMCMLTFPKDSIELTEILRTAGAPDGIAVSQRQLPKFPKLTEIISHNFAFLHRIKSMSTRERKEQRIRNT